MAENSWPFDNQPTTEGQYSRLLGAVTDSGPLRGLLVVPSSGMQIAVRPGVAVVRGFFYENTTNKLITVSAPPTVAGRTRVDRLVLRADPANNRVTVELVAGTQNATGGVAPALTQVEGGLWEESLALIQVPYNTGTISLDKIIDTSTPIGLTVRPLAKQLNRPPLSADQLALGINTGTRRMEIGIGGTWLPVEVNPHTHTQDDVLVNGNVKITTWAISMFAPLAHNHTQATVLVNGNQPITEWVDANYAAKGHGHNLGGDTVSGVLPVTKGGTGRTSVADIITMLIQFGDLEDVVTELISDHVYFRNALDTTVFEGRINASPYYRPLTGDRRQMYMDTTGAFGYSSSSRYVKQDFEEPDFTIDQLRAGVESIRFYRYRAEVAKQRKDADYHVATELGHIAEDLHDAGLWPWVIYEGHGDKAKPISVRYELLGMLAELYAKALEDHFTAELAVRDERQDRLEERVSRLEGGESDAAE
jgi:hypothetical protein